MSNELQQPGVEARLEQMLERLSLLEQDNQRLSGELASLKSASTPRRDVGGPVGGSPATAEQLEGHSSDPGVSRRGMFRFLGGAAAGVGIAVAGATIPADPAGATSGTM